MTIVQSLWKAYFRLRKYNHAPKPQRVFKVFALYHELDSKRRRRMDVRHNCGRIEFAATHGQVNLRSLACHKRRPPPGESNTPQPIAKWDTAGEFSNR
jgi:hypothetical protein